MNKTVTRVTTELDDLYVEFRGSGRPLLMIPGGMGDAGFYERVGERLCDEFQVISYDRRGNSRSSRRQPQNFEIGQQGRDAVAVLKALGHDSALVFGNSGGAVIALELGKAHKDVVQGMVVHEPPVLRVLPDDYWLQRFAEFFLMTRSGKWEQARDEFTASIRIPDSGYAAIPADFGERIQANVEFFYKEEMLAFSSYAPDTTAIKANRVPTIMSAGEYTLEAEIFYGLTAPIVAKALDCPMTPMPGHHMSYFDMPDEWSAALRAMLDTF